MTAETIEAEIVHQSESPADSRLGGLGVDSRKPVHDIRLVDRALRERWPIKPAVRRQLMREMAEIALNTEADFRARVAAAKLIVAADRLNQVEQRVPAPTTQTNIQVNIGQPADPLASLVGAAGQRLLSLLQSSQEQPAEPIPTVPPDCQDKS